MVSAALAVSCASCFRGCVADALVVCDTRETNGAVILCMGIRGREACPAGHSCCAVVLMIRVLPSCSVRLDLGSNWLRGSLPESLGALTGLQYLGLMDNLLTGAVPQAIGSLTGLT